MNSGEWHQEAIKLHFDDNMSYRDIANALDVKYEAVHSFLRRYKRNHNCTTISTMKFSPSIRVSTEHKKDSYSFNKGISTFEVEETLLDGQEVTPETIMKAKGLNPNEWEVLSFTKNIWQSQSKEGQPIDLCQSKLSVKPKKEPNEITFDDIDKYFEKVRPKCVFEKVNAFKYIDSNEILEIDVADLHCGLLSYHKETGSNFDLEIAQEKFLQGISDIVNRAKNKNFKLIYLCTLGDVIHIDNDKNTTTSGTQQDVDTRMSRIFDFSVETMRCAIEELLELKIPIRYVYTCGNHDRNTGYYLVKVLEGMYANNENIVFDSTPNPMKAIHFGKILVGLTHGDMSKKNRGTWLINDYRKEFGESEFIEEHSGHIHTEESKMINGIMCRSVMAQCGNSYWEHQQGYRSSRGIMSFVWNMENGLRETWYYYY